MKPTSTGRPRLPEYMTVKELSARGACESRIAEFCTVFKSGRCRSTRRNLARVRKVMGSDALEFLLDTYHVPGGPRAESRARMAYWAAGLESPEEVKIVANAFGLS